MSVCEALSAAIELKLSMCSLRPTWYNLGIDRAVQGTPPEISVGGWLR